MKKEPRLHPEKAMLTVSGMAFIMMIAPAWVPGFLASAAMAAVWGILLWKLPLPLSCLGDWRKRPEAYLLGLAFCTGFGFNFYNTWTVSGKMQAVAYLLGMPVNSLVFALAVLFTAVSAYAVGTVLSWLVGAAVQDYRKTKENTPAGNRISAGKALLILSAVYAIGISAILRANFYYQDDVLRAAMGYKQWDYFGRYLSTAMSSLVHMGNYLVDIAPLPQLLAVFLMAVSSVLVLYIVYERTAFTWWEIAAVVPLGLNPYFLECLSFRFDAPYMAVSVLAAILPLLFRNRNTLVYIFAAMLGTLAVCTSYQSATGVFPMLVILLALRMWNKKGKFFSFCLKSVAGYGAGLAYFKFVIMKPAYAGYVSNSLPELSAFVPNVVANLKRYYGLILSDFKPYWLLLAALLMIAFVWVSVQQTSRKRVLALLLSLTALALMLLLCFGVYPVLADTLFSPRAMYGFGVFLALLGVTAAEGRQVTLRVPALILSWAFVVFAFTYGNALSVQKEYTDFRIQTVIEDMNDLEIFQSGEPVQVQITGSIGQSPILDNMPQNYGILNRLVPETFAGSTDLALGQFWYYFDLRNAEANWDADFTQLELPVLEDHMYHTIYGRDNMVLIALK